VAKLAAAALVAFFVGVPRTMSAPLARRTEAAGLSGLASRDEDEAERMPQMYRES